MIMYKDQSGDVDSKVEVGKTCTCKAIAISIAWKKEWKAKERQGAMMKGNLERQFIYKNKNAL